MSFYKQVRVSAAEDERRKSAQSRTFREGKEINDDGGGGASQPEQKDV